MARSYRAPAWFARFDEKSEMANEQFGFDILLPRRFTGNCYNKY
jgi:hypothetical protein